MALPPKLLFPARIFLISLLAFTGGAKLLFPDATYENIDQSGLFPAWLTALSARGIPFLEIVIAILLSSGRWLVPGLYAALFLSSVFIGVHAATAMSGRVASCGCIGGASVVFDRQVLDLTFAVLSVAAAIASLSLLLASPRCVPVKDSTIDQ